MDGIRWTKLAAAGLLTAAVGCTSTSPGKTTSGLPASVPGQGESRWARLFGPPKPPGPPKAPPPAEPAPTSSSPAAASFFSKGKKGLSAETDVAFAKVKVEAAFLEGQSPQQADMIADAARQQFQKVLAAEPKNADALRGLAELYTRAGERDKALATYQTLVNAHPKDHRSAHEMALACARFDEWASAIGAVEYALSLDPENRRYQKTYGKCLAWSGQHDRALEVLARVMPEAEARYTLAKVLVEADQPALGREQLQLAAKADPSFAPAREALAQLDAPAGAAPRAAEENPVRQATFQGPGGN